MTNFRQNLQIIARGARRRCPQCGRSKLYGPRGAVRERCDACGLALRNRESDTWFIMYISTAIVTGVFIALLLWVIPTPQNKWLARGILAVVALAAFLGTAPMRKGMAIALDYLVDLRWNNQGELEFRP